MPRYNAKYSSAKERQQSGYACLLLVSLVLSIVLGGGIVMGQSEQPTGRDQTTAGQEPAIQITPDELAARIEALANRTDLTPEQSALLKSLYEESVANLKRTEEARARAGQFENDRIAAPKLLKEVKDHLQQLDQAQNKGRTENFMVGQNGEPTQSLSLTDLRQQLVDAQASLLSAQTAGKDIEYLRAARDARRKAIPDLLVAKEGELAKAQDDLKGLVPREGESDEFTQARRLRRATLVDALAAESDALKREQLMIDQRAELLMRRIDEVVLTTNLMQRRVNQWQKLVDDRQKAEAAQREDEARKAAKTAALLHPIAKTEAVRNQQLTVNGTALAVEKEKITRRKREITVALTQLTTDFQPVETRIELERQARERGDEPELPSSAFGLVLRKLRSTLPSQRELKRELSRIESRMSRIQAEAIETSSERRQILDQEDREDRVNESMALNAEEIPVEDTESVRDALLDIYRERVELLAVLNGDRDRQFAALNDLANELSRYLHQVQRYETYIGEHILWVRSTQFLGATDLSNLPNAVSWLTSIENWRRSVKALILDATRQPGLYIPVAMVILTLTIGFRAFRKRLARLGKEVGHARTDRFGSTVAAVMMTLILPLAVPLLVGFVGWRLTTIGEGEFERAVGSGLMNAARLMYMVLFVLAIDRDDGLAMIHFRKRAKALALVRCHLRWFVVVATIGTFVVETLDSQSNQIWADSLGRVTFIATMIASAIVLQRLARPSNGLLEEFIRRQPSGWTSRLRYIWSTAIVLVPCVLAVTALMGYFFTAVQIERRCVSTMLFILVLWLAHGLAMRWILMTQKRIAIKQSDAKKSVGEEEKAKSTAVVPAENTKVPPSSAPRTPTPGSTSSPKQEEHFAIPLAEVGLQAKRLLRTSVFLAFIIGSYIIWHDVLPALSALDGIVLFGANGEHPIALSRLIGAALVVIATIVASRNLPGFFEIAIMSRLPFQPSARYAIKSILQYVISIGGFLAAFGAIGVTWSDVQWLIAAATVGLGFGLQEIFANFVSGLIILFEQPIRIGDTITIGETTGNVTRIRMRATTITDWDRKELIVPNREFITGQLINWTLSDPILRLKLPIGIAYGSDTRKATDLLLEVAKSNPIVLDDPEPSVIFSGFGDSTLDFSLRVYIPDIEHFVPIKHYLNTAIDDAFRKAGIEIAFPQRDLHIRSISDALSVRNESSGRGEQENSSGTEKTSS